jgi:eukaryotic-like serine/threonine-protein kinase
MPLFPGTHLGPYEITGPLGSGGMGEVYRARDTRLERTVAIKILPAQFSADPVRKQRFEREAKTISSLNHPHICVLHDVGHQDGMDYLVMECMEGETLAKRLEKGSLPLEQVLKYGMQIADALDKAHRSGIVHRDLKPGNIMLTPAGAKLLDFGLAKPAVPLASVATMTAAVTQDSPMTEEGTIVGTFQYMSPEQVEGKEVDGRSDIFSLGAVLYEMVTGKRAFDGKSQLSVASAILEKEPGPISATKPMTPPALKHAVKKCLAKLPDERWQSASDLASELKWVAESGADGATGGVAKKPGKFRWGLVWAAMTLVAMALTMAATYYATRPTPEPQLMTSVIPPPGVFADTSGRIGPPQISPDGRRVAFIGCKTESAAASMLGGKTCSIWLRVLATAEAREVNDTSGAYYPFWSPDGREIAFFGDGKLKRVAADGGPVQVICDAADARGGSWGSSGIIIIAATRLSPILRVAADGGTPVAIAEVKPSSVPAAEVLSHRWPHFLPDGEHFLYVNAPNGSCTELNELHFASIDGKQDVSLMRTCSSATFANGNLLFWRDGNLVAQRFDSRTGVLSGAPAAIVEHANFEPLFSIAEFSTSAEGKLVYMAGDAPTGSQLVWYDRNGKVTGTLGENDRYKNVAISRDGLHVVADTISVKESKIRILDSRGTRTLMTLGNSDGAGPTWSPDGKQIYFTSTANGPQEIYVRAADGSGEEKPVLKFNKDQYGALFLTVSPDGKSLAYAVIDRATGGDIYTLALGGDGKPQPFLHSAANETAPAFSPDGRWLAYESDGSGRKEAYITPYPAGGAQYQVSTSGGERPVWGRDGKEIYYREGLTIMAVEVNTKASPVEFSSPKALFELASGNLNGRYYDVAPDGRFLANTAPLAKKEQSFSLVVNWPGRLKK